MRDSQPRGRLTVDGTHGLAINSASGFRSDRSESRVSKRYARPHSGRKAQVSTERRMNRENAASRTR